MQIRYRLVDTANNIGLGIFYTREQAQERVVEYCVQNVRLTIFDFKLVKVDLSEWQNIITFDDALEMLYLRNPNHPYRMAYLDMMGYNLKEVDAYDEFIENIGHDVLAYIKLRIITAAINGDWQADFGENNVRYYPTAYIYPQEEYEKIVFDKADLVVDNIYNNKCFAIIEPNKCSGTHTIPDTLAFASHEQAVCAISKFKDLYADYFFGRK
jgi:hypothetical protein|nr:MAG TPA: hypothetical protein [Caudoviricetes sp.]